MKIRAAAAWCIGWALFLTACTSTTVTGVWKKGDFAGPPLRSLVVLAQTGDRYNRPAWENSIAERLREKGLQALPAVTLLPPLTSPAQGQVIAGAREQGIDGVLVIRYVGIRTEERYHPPEIEYVSPWWGPYHLRGIDPYWHRWERRYWRPSYRSLWYYPYAYPPSYYERAVIRPGYTTSHQVVVVESYLYLASSGEQLWNMSSETIDPRSSNYLTADISQTLLQVLRRYGLIGTQ